jgi:hypothetical protein
MTHTVKSARVRKKANASIGKKSDVRRAVLPKAKLLIVSERSPMQESST